MRRGVLIGSLALFAAWFVVKALPFLLDGRPAIWSTPTSTAYTPQLLSPVTVPAAGRVCVDGVQWAPQARYVSVSVLPGPKKTAPQLRVEARAPGYRADGVIPAGLGQNARGYAKIAPAPREVTGSVCVVNGGRVPLKLFGVPDSGREHADVKVTVDGRPLRGRQLSVTLLTNPSQSILGRMGDVVAHVSTFRPVSPWLVWILLAVLVLGTPVAVAVALASAAGRDDEAEEGLPEVNGT